MARWNIEGTAIFPQTPEEIFEKITDSKNATVFPGIQEARRISGEERQEGTIFECRVGLDGIGHGTIQIEVTKIVRPYLAEAKINQGNFPLNGIIFEITGKAKWQVSEENGGCRAVLTTEGKIGGLAGYLPGAQILVDRKMQEAVRKTLVNLKNGSKNSP